MKEETKFDLYFGFIEEREELEFPVTDQPAIIQVDEDTEDDLEDK